MRFHFLHGLGLIGFTFTPLLFGESVPPAKTQRWLERKQFVSKDSSEAKVSFNHHVEILSDKKPGKEKVLNTIERQLWHLFGPLGESKRLYGVPKGEHQITEVGAPQRVAGYSNAWEVTYQYDGVMQIRLGNSRNGLEDSDLEILLPNNPELIYAAGMVGDENPCTDEHYQSEGDFWYFWNPHKRRCRLKEGVDYERVRGVELERLKNTRTSYPNYPRLVNDEGVIEIHFLMGLDDPKNSARNRNPLTSSDINAKTYREIRRTIKEIGFEPKEKAWNSEAIRRNVGMPHNVKMNFAPYVEEFVRSTQWQTLTGKPVVIQVRLFFGPSGINEEANAPFHYFYRDALAKASVVLYDGHSGLGGHLSLETIEESEKFKIKFNPNYQIIFINSCSSYTYYNAAYFERKKTKSDPRGIKNLDILVNGLATSFGVLHDTNMALLKGIVLWGDFRKPVRTYQYLTDKIDSSNLFSVNGDEDDFNPKSIEELYRWEAKLLEPVE